MSNVSNKLNKLNVWKEGYEACQNFNLPSTCPYLNRVGDNTAQIDDWMKGWSEAFKDLTGRWTEI